MIFYLLLITLTISFILVIYFIIKFYKDKNKYLDKDIDDWTNENKIYLKNFISENGTNKNTIDCIYDKIILTYSFAEFNNFYKEISKYKNNPDPYISLSKNTTSFMSNLLDFEKTCSE
jgi:hypothetical protein